MPRSRGKKPINEGVPSARKQNDNDDGEDGKDSGEEGEAIFFLNDQKESIDQQDTDACESDDRVNKEETEDEGGDEDDALGFLNLSEPDEEE